MYWPENGPEYFDDDDLWEQEQQRREDERMERKYLEDEA